LGKDGLRPEFAFVAPNGHISDDRPVSRTGGMTASAPRSPRGRHFGLGQLQSIRRGWRKGGSGSPAAERLAKINVCCPPLVQKAAIPVRANVVTIRRSASRPLRTSIPILGLPLSPFVFIEM
jgi:hypothetical protein